MCKDGRGKIYKERHLKLKPDVCVSVFLCECVRKCSACFETAGHVISWPVSFVVFKEVRLVQLKERIK